MKKTERIITIAMLIIISLSNVVTPVAYAAEVALPNMAIPGTDLPKAQYAATPKFSTDTGSVLGASTSLLTVGSASLDLTDGSAGSANKRIPVQMQKLAKKVYRSDEDVTLAVTNPDNEAFVTSVQDGTGNNVSVPLTETNNGSTTTVDLASSDTIKPGKYKVVVTDQNGKNSSQDFTWGVLALNTDKSVYYPNETADISMAVLNDQGDMVCDAKAALSIKNPQLGINDVLSTDASASAKQIVVSSQCDKHDFSLQPDYEAHYKFGGAGTYQLQLTAQTPNGTHTISDSIQVKNAIPFDVQRVSATRIYPPNSYPMTFNITANRDFNGTVTETVPDSFTITPATDSATTVSSYNNMETVYLNSSDPAVQMEQAISASSSGGLVMPFHGNFPITQGFGAQLTDPTLQAFYIHYGLAGHDGIDFGLPMNTPLYAVDSGTVIWAGPGDYGTMVTIQHAWGETYYGHMTNPVVSVGQGVTKGQLIGYSGMSGEATGPHLHFGMKPMHPDMQNGYYGKVDPMAYLPIGQGQSIAALPGGSNPIAQAVYSDTVLGASDSAATPSPALSTNTPLPGVSPTSVPTPTTGAISVTTIPTPTSPAPTATQSAAPTAVPSPTQQPQQITTIGKSNTAPANTSISVLQKQILLDEQIANSALTEKVKIISWHVSLKKGQSTSVGYDFQGPHVSPQFYLLGPMHFYDSHGKDVFSEQRQWQIASDDVGIEWYQNNSGSTFNGYSWPYRKKIDIAHGQVNSTVSFDSIGGGSIVDFSHNVCNSGCSNPALLVGVAVAPVHVGSYDDHLINTPTVTYNGTSMTLLASIHANNSVEGLLYVFGLLSASTGNHTVEINVSGAPAVVTAGSMSFSNVTSWGTAATKADNGGNPTNPNVTVSSTTSGNIVAGFASSGSNFTATSAPATSRFNANFTGGLGNGNSAGATSPSTGAAVAINWTTAADQWAAIGVEAKGSSVAYDTVGPSSSGYTPTGVSSMSWNHTVSGPNPAILAELTVAAASTGMSATATDNGTSMTLLNKTEVDQADPGPNPNPHAGYIAVFGLTNAPTGTNKIVITITGGGGTATEISGGSESFDNVSGFGTAVSASCDTGAGGDCASPNTVVPPSVTVSSSANSIIAGFVASGSGINTANSPATTATYSNQDSSTGAGNSQIANSVGTGSNVTISWPDPADYWAAVGVEVQAATTLSNFPVLVNLSNDNDIKKAQANCNDVVFTDATGRTLMNFDLDNTATDCSSGNLHAWVKIPTLSTSSDTIIYMYFGNPSAASQASASSVWDNNFKAVFHMANSSGTSVSDSTSNNLPGTSTNTISATSGEIGNAMTFNGTSDSVENDNLVSALATGNFSASFWFDPTLTGGYTSASANVYMMDFDDATANNDFAVEIGTAVGCPNGNLCFDLDGNGAVHSATTSQTSWAQNTWHFVTVTFSMGTGMQMYIDGSADGSTVVNQRGYTPTSAKMSIGSAKADSLTDYFHGNIDEVRLSNIQRAQGWQKTEYNNENAPGSFYSLGNLETSIYAPTLSEVLGHGDWFDSTGTRQPFTF